MQFNRCTAAAIMLAAAVVATDATAASAAAGDITVTRTSTHLDAGTNQCKPYARVVTEVLGYPNSPDDIVLHILNYKGCVSEARVQYIKAKGTTKITSPWARAAGGNYAALYLPDVWRCKTELRVRRKDGSWFMISSPINTENKRCA